MNQCEAIPAIPPFIYYSSQPGPPSIPLVHLAPHLSSSEATSPCPNLMELPGEESATDTKTSLPEPRQYQKAQSSHGKTLGLTLLPTPATRLVGTRH